MTTIYLLDDSRVSLIKITELIESLGIEVAIQTFSSPNELFQVLHVDVPDLLITDYEMPEMNGIEVCQKIRADKNLEFLPVMLLSSHSEEKKIVEFLNAGADFYVNKALHTDLLVGKIKAFIRMTNFQMKKIEVEKLASIADTIVSINHQVNNVIASGLGYLARFKRRNKEHDFEDIDKAINCYHEVADILKKLSLIESLETESYVGDTKMLKS